MAATCLLVGLAACSNPIPGDPHGPYAPASPAPAQAVINRGCNNTPHQGPEATDVGFIKSSLLRQKAQLQRVDDDLTGAVPGGNLPGDAGLAQANARVIVDLAEKSTLCSPFKGKLLAAARTLASADDALAGAPGGDSLQGALSAFDALSAIASNPPSTSPSP